MRRLWVLLVTLSTAASAQSVSGNLQSFSVDPGGRGSLWVGNGQTLPARAYRLSFGTSYAHAPLRGPDGEVRVGGRLGVEVLAAVGITDWLELDASAPAVVAQFPGVGFQVASGGLGTPWLHAKVALLQPRAPISMLVGVGVGVPVGSRAALANQGVEGVVRAQLGKTLELFQVGVELGALMREQTSLGLGSEAYAAVMFTGVARAGPRGEASVRVVAPLGRGASAGVEGLLAVRWPLGPLELFAGAGPGFGGAPATPSVRAVLGVAFSDVDQASH